MSRERARRREARQAEAARRQEAAERRAEVADRRARRWDAMRAWFPRRGRVGRFGARRTRAELAAVLAVAGGIQVLSWYLIDSWPLRTAVAVLTLLAVPALTVLTFDRSTHR